MTSIDEQINMIMEGLYEGHWRVTSLGTFAEVDGLGLAVSNILVSDGPALPFGVYVAKGVPFSRKLVEDLAEWSGDIPIGGLKIVGGGDNVDILLSYTIMRPWLEVMELNHLGVTQALLDVIGNLPRIGADVAQRVFAAHGGTKPALEDGWEIIPIWNL